MKWLVYAVIAIGLCCCIGIIFFVCDSLKIQSPATVTVESPVVAQTNQPVVSSSEASWPKNKYNLSTPSSQNPYGCYEQQGNVVTITLNDSAEPEVKTLANADVMTFQDLSMFNLCFGKDKDNVYYYDQIIPWATPNTFDTLTYFRGPTIFLKNGNQIISWKPTNNYSTDISTTCTPGVTGGFCLIPNSDANTFQVIETGVDISPWAKDAFHVYCSGTPLQGANPLSVEVIDPRHLSISVDGVVHTYTACSVVNN